MNRALFVFAVLTALGISGVLGTVGVSAAQSSNDSVQANAQQETRKFTVENMTCAACPITVRKAMQGVQGVKSVKVDFGAKTATVVFDPDATTTEAISQASANAGYPANVETQNE